MTAYFAFSTGYKKIDNIIFAKSFIVIGAYEKEKLLLLDFPWWVTVWGQWGQILFQKNDAAFWTFQVWGIYNFHISW